MDRPARGPEGGSLVLQLCCQMRHPVPLDLTLEVEGVTVLLGRSGAGKSSFLRGLLGLLPAQVSPWGDLPTERRPLGYLPQGYALFPHLRVWQNVAFPLRGARQERRRAADELLDRVGLAHLAEQMPETLSGGQRQRVALARAMARRPRLLLLDEPTSALDPQSRDEVIDALLEEAKTFAVPLLVVSHDVGLCARAQRMAILQGGEIQAQGNPTQLFSRPPTRFVAQLLGMENFFFGRIEAALDGEAYLVQADSLHLQAVGPPGLPVGTAVTLGIRAEDVLLVQKRGLEKGNIFSATLRTWQQETLWTRFVTGGPLVLGGRFWTRDGDSATLGENVSIQLLPERLFLWPNK